MKWLPFLLLFVACSGPITIQEGNFLVEYADGVVSYSAVIQKPTPCNTLKVDELIMESYPVQIKIDVSIEKHSGFCIQVIDYENITGEIDIGHKPRSFSVHVNGGQVFTTLLN